MIGTLKERLGDKVSTSPSVLDAHGRDENYPRTLPPLAVVFAESVGDVREALAWAREHNTPVIPFGAGTSLEGHLVPQAPAISLDLSRMNRILDVQPEDFLVTVEPGVTRSALDAALRHTGLFFPVDPGADASLGGMAATNASGTTTVKYGGMRHNVAALEVVLANGEALQLGRPVRKTSSGYDLKDLFVGSAGTLGVITRLTLRLHPVPPHVHTLRVFFPSLSAAAEASYMIMASALPVARLELMDELSMRAINGHLGRDYPERPALFLESTLRQRRPSRPSRAPWRISRARPGPSTSTWRARRRSARRSGRGDTRSSGRPRISIRATPTPSPTLPCRSPRCPRSSPTRRN